MLSLAIPPRVEAVEEIDPAQRFECWTVADALQAYYGDPLALREGYRAGMTGAPCPGAARCNSYRLGWEIGAINARRVPEPAWLFAVVAQDQAGCIGSA